MEFRVIDVKTEVDNGVLVSDTPKVRVTVEAVAYVPRDDVTDISVILSTPLIPKDKSMPIVFDQSLEDVEAGFTDLVSGIDDENLSDRATILKKKILAMTRSLILEYNYLKNHKK